MIRVDGVAVRPARIADAERMAVLSGQLGYPTTPEDMRRRLDRTGRAVGPGAGLPRRLRAFERRS